jgi:hypothetical protein
VENDVINLPVGYEDTLEYLLAGNLCGINNMDNPYVFATGKSRLETLERNNLEVPEMNLSGGQRRYNVYSDRNE